MSAFLPNILKTLLPVIAREVVSPENIQYIMKCLVRRARNMAEDTDTKLDDIALAFLEGIATSYDKAETVSEWLLDLTIPNRCSTPEMVSYYTEVLESGDSDFAEKGAWFAGVLLPILVVYFREKRVQE